MRTSKRDGPSKLARCDQEKSGNFPVIEIWPEMASDQQETSSRKHSNTSKMDARTRKLVGKVAAGQVSVISRCFLPWKTRRLTSSQSKTLRLARSISNGTGLVESRTAGFGISEMAYNIWKRSKSVKNNWIKAYQLLLTERDAKWSRNED